MYIVRTVPGLPAIGKIKGEKAILTFLFFLAVLLMSIALVVDQAHKDEVVKVMRAGSSSCSRRAKKSAHKSKIHRKSAHSRGKKTVDIITMDGCGWCQKIQNELNEIRKHLHDYEIKIHKHTDAAAQKFKANAFPVAFVNGDESKSIKGYQPAHKFAVNVRSL
jgi:glutaredoxin